MSKPLSIPRMGYKQQSLLTTRALITELVKQPQNENEEEFFEDQSEEEKGKDATQMYIDVAADCLNYISEIDTDAASTLKQVLDFLVADSKTKPKELEAVTKLKDEAIHSFQIVKEQLEQQESISQNLQQQNQKYKQQNDTAQRRAIALQYELDKTKKNINTLNEQVRSLQMELQEQVNIQIQLKKQSDDAIRRQNQQTLLLVQVRSQMEGIYGELQKRENQVSQLSEKLKQEHKLFIEEQDKLHIQQDKHHELTIQMKYQTELMTIHKDEADGKYQQYQLKIENIEKENQILMQQIQLLNQQSYKTSKTQSVIQGTFSQGQRNNIEMVAKAVQVKELPFNNEMQLIDDTELNADQVLDILANLIVEVSDDTKEAFIPPPNVQDPTLLYEEDFRGIIGVTSMQNKITSRFISKKGYIACFDKNQRLRASYMKYKSKFYKLQQEVARRLQVESCKVYIEILERIDAFMQVPGQTDQMMKGYQLMKQRIDAIVATFPEEIVKLAKQNIQVAMVLSARTINQMKLPKEVQSITASPPNIPRADQLFQCEMQKMVNENIITEMQVKVFQQQIIADLKPDKRPIAIYQQNQAAVGKFDKPETAKAKESDAASKDIMKFPLIEKQKHQYIQTSDTFFKKPEKEVKGKDDIKSKQEVDQLTEQVAKLKIEYEALENQNSQIQNELEQSKLLVQNSQNNMQIQMFDFTQNTLIIDVWNQGIQTMPVIEEIVFKQEEEEEAQKLLQSLLDNPNSRIDQTITQMLVKEIQTNSTLVTDSQIQTEPTDGIDKLKGFVEESFLQKKPDNYVQMHVRWVQCDIQPSQLPKEQVSIIQQSMAKQFSNQSQKLQNEISILKQNNDQLSGQIKAQTDTIDAHKQEIVQFSNRTQSLNEMIQQLNSLVGKDCNEANKLLLEAVDSSNYQKEQLLNDLSQKNSQLERKELDYLELHTQFKQLQNDYLEIKEQVGGDQHLGSSVHSMFGQKDKQSNTSNEINSKLGSNNSLLPNESKQHVVQLDLSVKTINEEDSQTRQSQFNQLYDDLTKPKNLISHVKSQVSMEFASQNYSQQQVEYFDSTILQDNTSQIQNQPYANISDEKRVDDILTECQFEINQFRNPDELVEEFELVLQEQDTEVMEITQNEAGIGVKPDTRTVIIQVTPALQKNLKDYTIQQLQSKMLSIQDQFERQTKFLDSKINENKQLYSKLNQLSAQLKEQRSILDGKISNNHNIDLINQNNLLRRQVNEVTVKFEMLIRQTCVTDRIENIADYPQIDQMVQQIHTLKHHKDTQTMFDTNDDSKTVSILKNQLQQVQQLLLSFQPEISLLENQVISLKQEKLVYQASNDSLRQTVSVLQRKNQCQCEMFNKEIQTGSDIVVSTKTERKYENSSPVNPTNYEGEDPLLLQASSVAKSLEQQNAKMLITRSLQSEVREKDRATLLKEMGVKLDGQVVSQDSQLSNDFKKVMQAIQLKQDIIQQGAGFQNDQQLGNEQYKPKKKISPLNNVQKPQNLQNFNQADKTEMQDDIFDIIKQSMDCQQVVMKQQGESILHQNQPMEAIIQNTVRLSQRNQPLSSQQSSRHEINNQQNISSLRQTDVKQDNSLPNDQQELKESNNLASSIYSNNCQQYQYQTTSFAENARDKLARILQQQNKGVKEMAIESSLPQVQVEMIQNQLRSDDLSVSFAVRSPQFENQDLVEDITDSPPKRAVNIPIFNKRFMTKEKQHSLNQFDTLQSKPKSTDAPTIKISFKKSQLNYYRKLDEKQWQKQIKQYRLVSSNDLQQQPQIFQQTSNSCNLVKQLKSTLNEVPEARMYQQQPNKFYAFDGKKLVTPFYNLTNYRNRIRQQMHLKSTDDNQQFMKVENQFITKFKLGNQFQNDYEILKNIYQKQPSILNQFQINLLKSLKLITPFSAKQSFPPIIFQKLKLEQINLKFLQEVKIIDQKVNQQVYYIQLDYLPLSQTLQKFNKLDLIQFLNFQFVITPLVVKISPYAKIINMIQQFYDDISQNLNLALYFNCETPEQLFQRWIESRFIAPALQQKFIWSFSCSLCYYCIQQKPNHFLSLESEIPNTIRIPDQTLCELIMFQRIMSVKSMQHLHQFVNIRQQIKDTFKLDKQRYYSEMLPEEEVSVMLAKCNITLSAQATVFIKQYLHAPGLLLIIFSLQLQKRVKFVLKVTQLFTDYADDQGLINKETALKILLKIYNDQPFSLISQYLQDKSFLNLEQFIQLVVSFSQFADDGNLMHTAKKLFKRADATATKLKLTDAAVIQRLDQQRLTCQQELQRNNLAAVYACNSYLQAVLELQVDEVAQGTQPVKVDDV